VNVPNLSAWAVKHPAVVLYLILAAGAAGLYAYLGMGRAEDPSFTIKTMVVTADWPGATSDEVQRQVADKIEEKLQETPHLDYLRTYSLPGRAVITVQLRTDTPPRARTVLSPSSYVRVTSTASSAGGRSVPVRTAPAPPGPGPRRGPRPARRPAGRR